MTNGSQTHESDAQQEFKSQISFPIAGVPVLMVIVVV